MGYKETKSSFIPSVIPLQNSEHGRNNKGCTGVV